MNKIAPFLTIGIPVYNGEKYLKRIVESLLNQSFTDFEVIFYDDCSNDNSYDLITKTVTKDERFTIIRGSSNIGNVPQIMKEVIFPKSKGSYFSYMSQDDFLDENSIQRAYDTIQLVQSDISLFKFIFYDPNQKINKSINGYYDDVDKVISGKEAFLASLDWKISGAGIYKRDLIEQVGYSDFNMYADEYSIRMFMLNAKSVSFNSGLFYYNIDNSDAITRKMKPALFSKIYKETLLFLVVLQKFEDEVIKDRLEKITQMFYDYRIILKKSDFSKQDSNKISRDIITSLDLIKKQNINFYKFNYKPKILFKTVFLFRIPMPLFKIFFLKN